MNYVNILSIFLIRYGRMTCVGKSEIDLEQRLMMSKVYDAISGYFWKQIGQ